jgi:hypothetical protein
LTRYQTIRISRTVVTLKPEEDDQNLGATHGLNQKRTWRNAEGWFAIAAR